MQLVERSSQHRVLRDAGWRIVGGSRIQGICLGGDIADHHQCGLDER